jgi:hypothetical protein
MDDVETQLVTEWKNSEVQNVRGREFLWTSINVLEKFKNNLEAYIADAVYETEKNKKKLNE